MQRPTRTTERLFLRPLADADAGDVERLAGDRAVADTALNVPHPFEAGMAQAWIAADRASFEQGTAVTFALTRRSDRAFLGAIGLMQIAPGHQAELGYWIGAPFWGQGYATEAAREVVAYAFTELGLVRVHAHHLGRNPASGRVLRKVGMQHEGRLRHHVRRWGTFEDLDLYGVLVEACHALR